MRNKGSHIFRGGRLNKFHGSAFSWHENHHDVRVKRIVCEDFERGLLAFLPAVEEAKENVRDDLKTRQSQRVQCPPNGRHPTGKVVYLLSRIFVSDDIHEGLVHSRVLESSSGFTINLSRMYGENEPGLLFQRPQDREVVSPREPALPVTTARHQHSDVASIPGF
jgi:hypothetical protein